MIADGAIDMGVGDADAPDATITQSYDTAVKLAKSELSVVTAFMTGKVKVAGNMGMLMGLQGCAVPAADRDAGGRDRLLMRAGRRAPSGATSATVT